MSSIHLSPLEAINGYIWLDGKFIKWQDAKIHVLTHSLHYAGSVFEGEKSFNGKIFKVREHTERLINSAKLMRLELSYSIDEIISACYEVLEKNNLKDAYIRPMAWRSTSALMVRPQNPITHLMIAAWQPRKPQNDNPLRVSVSKWRKPANDAHPIQCKSASQYAMLSIAITEAIDQGFDDALMLDKEGYIAECTTSNIFFIQDNQLFTPTASYCLNGITRQTIIAIAENLGIKVFEKDISLEELSNFNDCFITGTACGLKEIGSITSSSNGNSFTKSALFSALKTNYQKLIMEQ